ncbi:MAG: sporulation protein YunB [Corallococcus sp.]|nr:sporulation protein YunB [Corallococcus sp.]
MSNYAVINRSARRKKKKKIINKIIAIALAIVIICIALACWVYWKSMTPTILDIAQTRLKSETTRAVNDAINLVLGDNANYDEFVTVEKNSDNEITMLYANSTLANSLARNAALISQSKINALNSFDVDIPLGTLSGVPLFSEKGPKVNITVTPIGTVTCTFTSVFETAGINQTIHRIYINVESVVDLIIPTAHSQVTTSIPVLLCESVIIGRVPQTFLQGDVLLGSS